MAKPILTDILFVLKTGIQLENLPPEMSCGCGMSCWRRVRDWQRTGVWERLHQTLLQRMREHDQIAWERASLDSASVPSPLSGPDRIRPSAANAAASITGWLTSVVCCR